MRQHTRHCQQPTNWFADLRIAPLFAAIFLLAQFLASAHAAAYADANHVHDGTPCIIAAAHKQSDAMDTTAPVPGLARIAVAEEFILPPQKGIVPTRFFAHGSRGPPANS